MSYEAKIICDSINPAGYRLTTMEISYPRFVHSEFMTHRMFSRNAASSRAIPIEKMIAKVEEDSAMPVYWGKNQKGMQAAEELSIDEIEKSKRTWLITRDNTIFSARVLATYDLHKQIVNRLLEPFSWITVIVTGTEAAYANFFALRCHKDAQPEIAKIAYMMKELYLDPGEGIAPESLEWGDWHLPYITEEEFGLCLHESSYDIKHLLLPKISAARCARVSYLTQDGKRDIEKDLELYNRLVGQIPLHASPLEHVAYACNNMKWYDGIGCNKCLKSNFSLSGWHQLRKDLADEYIIKL